MERTGCRTVSEAQVSREVARVLRLAGYRVSSTEEHRRRVRCPDCGQCFTPHGGTGVTQGNPDLLVTHERWRGMLLPGEVKGPRTALSPAQRALADQGLLRVWRFQSPT